MTAPSSTSQRPGRGGASTPNRPCPLGCGATFWTGVGAEEHARLGCESSPGARPVEVSRNWRRSAHGKAGLHKRGLAVTALNNSKRFACAECGKESTPAGIGLHQRYSGHIGRTELT